MSKEEILNGQEYKFEKISPLAQFHIVRRLAPVLGELLSAVGPTFKGGKSEMKQEDMMKALGPITVAISKLSDEDSEYVLFGLLKGVSRKQIGGGWAKVSVETSLMFQDIDMKIMFQLAMKSFMVNLGGFIDALPSGLIEGALQAQ